MDSPCFDVTASHIDRLKANIIFVQTAAPYSSRSHTNGLSHPRTRSSKNGKDCQPQEDLTQDDVESGLPSVVQDSQDITNTDKPSSDYPNILPSNAIKKFQVMSTQGDLTNSTQPISQSFYDLIIQRSKSTRYEDKDGNSTTQRSYEEGECGHVDITSSFVTRRDQADPQEQLEDLADSEPVDLFSPAQTQPNLTQWSESQRFKLPTPAGRKRTYNGDLVDTPAPVRNPLARDDQVTPGGLFGLSQAFAATQAASSPISNGLPTGPRSDRPSPNIELQARTTTAPSSSPSMRPISEFRRAVTEPAARYVSLEESQAEREHHVHNQPEQAEEVDDVFGSFEQVDSVIARRSRHQARTKQVKRELKSLSSPVLSPGEYVVTSPPKLPLDNNGDEEEHENSSADSVLTASVTGDDSDVESEVNAGQDERETVDHERSSDIVRRDDDDDEDEDIDKDYTAVLVPKTGPRRRLNPETSVSQVDASPSLRHGLHAAPLIQDLQSSEPLRIMDSQPSESRTRLTSSLGEESPRRTQRYRQYADSGSGRARTRIFPIAEGSEAGEAVGIDKSTIENDTVAETSSDIRAGVPQDDTPTNNKQANSKQSVTVTVTEFETAPTHEDPVPPPESSQLSSPIRTTPPGRKRMRMLEISAEPSPRRSQSQLNFDAEAILQLDEDQVTADLLQSSPSRAISPTKLNGTESHEPTVGEHIVGLSERSSPLSGNDTGHDMSIANKQTHDILFNEPHFSPEMSQEIVKPGRHKRLQQSGGTPVQLVMPLEVGSGRHSVYDLPLSPEKSNVLRPPERRLQGQSHKKQKTQHTSVLHEPRMVKRLRPIVQVDTPVASPVRDNFERPQPIETTVPTEEVSTPKDTSRDEIIAPQMVFAFYRGIPKGYYPARLLGGSESSGYQVHWDGYDPTEVHAHDIKALDLRVGDTIKVLAEGFSKIPYIIRGFSDKVMNDHETTDIRGYRKLTIVPKQRKSLPADKAEEMQSEVSISSIYLDTNMWTHMKSRNQEVRPAASSIAASGFATPLEQVSNPSTPSSKGRRPLATAVSTLFPVAKGMFSNMSFAISYELESQKNFLVNLVRKNGGLVIHDSFHDLLEPISIELKSQYTGIGFTALLADRHSRKEKYMQALALGLPCLSGKWVEACVKHKEICDWQTYLLPAGESAELDNATRSRVLPPITIHTAKLSDMLASRPTLFGDTQVVVVIGSDEVEVKRAPYLFLIQALGATQIHKVEDLEAAKDLLDSDQEGDIQWVFVDDKDVDKMQALAHHDSTRIKKVKGRPRPKTADLTAKKQCKIAGNELIVQSLILGRLCEPRERSKRLQA